MNTSSDSTSVSHPHTTQVLGVDDAGEILTLQRAAYITEAQAHDDLHLPPLVQTRDDLRAEVERSDMLALGVRDQGRLVGALRLQRDGDTVELGRLTVAPDRQGQGIGTALLASAETAFDQVSRMLLFTGEHSVGNIRLYRRHGYREVGRTPAGEYDLVHLAKAL